MQITYYDLQTKSRVLQSLTGLTPQEFEELLLSFEEAWADFLQETFHNKPRKRAYGGGRKAHLEELEDKLLFILVYFRLYPTQEVQGYLFGMGQAQANEWVHRLSPLLNRGSWGMNINFPNVSPWKLKQVLSQCPSLEFMIDGTERPINRPQDKSKRKTYYSGKKKAHTVKNNVITERGGKVHLFK